MSTKIEATDFQVGRADLRQHRFAKHDVPALQAGQVLLRVDKFGFTANNITYAVFGEAMSYWKFFPAPEGWGIVPVWGYADVAESQHPSIAAGERVYGYLPMSTHHVVQADRVGDARFVDATAHRQELAHPYLSFVRVGGDPSFQARFEDHQAIFRPLFATSFLIEDFLADNGLFGASSVILSSASSKTALGLAYLLSRKRPQNCEVIGLTSPGNLAFCEKTGYYDRVLAYEKLSELAPGTPSVYVDMAGNGQLLHDLHHHFGAQMKHSCIVGASHWEERSTQHHLPGAKPQFFFAPVQLQKRHKDWGAAGVEARYGEAARDFTATTDAWLKIVHGSGHASIGQVYAQMLEGKVPPEQGHILSW